MNMNILKLLAPLALLAGCAKTTVPEYSWTTDPDAVIVSASAGVLTKSNPTGTAETQKTFNGPDGGKFLGDEIAISAVDDAGQVEKTVTYRLDDSLESCACHRLSRLEGPCHLQGLVSRFGQGRFRSPDRPV